MTRLAPKLPPPPPYPREKLAAHLRSLVSTFFARQYILPWFHQRTIMTDQTARMRRLTCALGVRIGNKGHFRTNPNDKQIRNWSSRPVLGIDSP